MQPARLELASFRLKVENINHYAKVAYVSFAHSTRIGNRTQRSGHIRLAVPTRHIPRVNFPSPRNCEMLVFYMGVRYTQPALSCYPFDGNY